MVDLLLLCNWKIDFCTLLRVFFLTNWISKIHYFSIKCIANGIKAFYYLSVFARSRYGFVADV